MPSLRPPDTDDQELTLRAVEPRGWMIVLLGQLSKRPTGSTWTTTTKPETIRRHLNDGGNIGLVCGPTSGVAVADFDDIQAAREMVRALGRLTPWVRTGSGKIHCYLRWTPGLPAKLRWKGRIIGELQRGPADAEGHNLQQVVIPPSIHPDTRQAYRWLVDPAGETLAPLPEVYLRELRVPVDRPARQHDDLDLGDVQRRALEQPGARRRVGGIKFQCPGCRDEGHDKHMDNALLRDDGRWGCAIDPAHRRAIGRVLLETSLAGVRTARRVPAWHS